jgi:Tfp pilus assembly protein PilF
MIKANGVPCIEKAEYNKAVVQFKETVKKEKLDENQRAQTKKGQCAQKMNQIQEEKKVCSPSGFNY